MINRRPGKLFRRSEGQCRGERSGLGQTLRIVTQPSDAEVGQQYSLRLSGIGRRQQDIGGFHIPMQYTVPVRMVESRSHRVA